MAPQDEDDIVPGQLLALDVIVKLLDAREVGLRPDAQFIVDALGDPLTPGVATHLIVSLADLAAQSQAGWRMHDAEGADQLLRMRRFGMERMREMGDGALTEETEFMGRLMADVDEAPPEPQWT